MSEYKKALHVLMKSPVTDDIVKYLTNVTLKVLPQSNYPSPPSSPSRHSKEHLPSLMTFITRLVRYTNVYTPTLLATVCYLNKLKRILPKDATGLPSTIHRLFLACLILRSTGHNDSSPKNVHWARYTDGLFSLEDINLMERQLLQLLNWDINVSEDDLILDLRPLLEPIKEDLQRSYLQRKRIYSNNQQKVSAGAYHSYNYTKGHNYTNSNSYNSYNSYNKLQSKYVPKSELYHHRNISVSSNLSSTSTLVDRNSPPHNYVYV